MSPGRTRRKQQPRLKSVLRNQGAACVLYLRTLRDIPEIAYQGRDDLVPHWHPWAGTPTSMSPIRMR